ncbi:uncharacterized protein [Panulirus ornatus]|uniref:uncharacterized protein n=1 Tax=Panulirus ornatus TaxID=150431 RepID=UPI003A885704
MLVVWLTVWAAAASALSYQDLDPSQVLLDDLSTEELDTLLRSRLEDLQNDIEQKYELHLQQYEANIIKLLSRSRRDVKFHEAHNHDAAGYEYYLPSPPTLEPGYWHSYTYNTIVEREMVQIEDIRVASNYGAVDITHVFPLFLRDLPAICRSEAGWGVVVDNGQMVAVQVHGRWTASPSGCPCDLDDSKTCACCSPGGCLCKQADGHDGDACVECGKEASDHACQAARWRPLELDAAVGFQYHLHLATEEEEEALQQVVITAKNYVVSFFKANVDGLQPLSSQFVGHRVTHLGYGEALVDFYGILKKRRFLVTFNADEDTHELREVTVSKTESTLSVGLAVHWTASGSEMKTWAAGGQLLVGVLHREDLLLHHLQEDAWHEFHVDYAQTLTCEEQIISWDIMSWGFEHYLLLVTHSVARLYIQTGLRYEILQGLHPSHGLSFFHAFLPLHVPSCRDEVVLLTGHDTNLVAYVWNGTAQSMQVGYTTNLDVSIGNWDQGYVDPGPAEQHVQVVVHAGVGVVSLVLWAKLVLLTDPVLLQNIAIDDSVTALQEEHARQLKVVEQVEESLARSVDCGDGVPGSGTIVINGSVTVLHSIDVTGPFNTSEFDATSIGLPGTELDGVSYSTYREQLLALAQYTEELDNLNTQLITIRSTLDDAVPATGSTRVVGGVKTLVTSDLHLDTLAAYSLNVEQVFDGLGIVISIEQTLGDIIRINDSRKITGRKTFINTLEVETLHTDHLDDVPVSDLVTTTGSQTIAGASFSTLVADTIVMTEGSTVAGIDLSEDVVYLSGGASLGPTTFLEGLAVKQHMEVKTNTVSGVDLDRLYKKTLRTNGGTLLGSLVFDSEVTMGNLHAVEMMGINTAHFMSTTVFKNRAATMRGQLTVPTVHVDGNLTVHGNINGDSFPLHFPVRDGAHLHFGAKRFSSVHFGSVTLEDGATVDGLSVHELVTLNTQQHITGKKIFTQGVDVKGNLDITTSIIDGVNLDQLAGRLSLSELPVWDFDVNFTKPVHVPSIQCGGTVNGLNFADLAADIVYTDQGSAIITGNKHFTKSLTISDAVFSNTFNGERFDDLVTTNGAQSFTGPVVLQNDVSFESLTVTGTVDGVDVGLLASTALYLDRPEQVVKGKKIFRNTVTAGGLEITGTINNLDFSNVVTKSGEQNFSAPQILHSATFSAVKAYEIQMSDGFTVNGVDISELAKRRVRLTSADDYNGVLTVQGTVSALGSLSAAYINNYNVQHLKEDIVTDDTSTTISGNLVFSHLHVDQSVTTAGKVGANGINISHIDAQAVKLASDNNLSGAIAWGDIIMLDDVDVGGLVNGVDLVQLNADAVYKDTTALQNITGKKVFQSGISVKGNIDTQTTNGIDLATRLFTLHTDQTITAVYHFSNLRAEQYVHLVGTFCNVDLKTLANSALKRDNDVIFGDVNFLSTANITDLTIDGSLNNVNLEERLGDAVRQRDIGVSITGTKTFTASAASSSTTTFKNIKVSYLNDVDLDYYLSHVVLKTSPAHLLNAITVIGTVTAPSVTADSLVVEGTIDGVDYQSLLANAVNLTGDQTIQSSLVFTETVSVVGDVRTETLNGLVLETDFLTTSTDQHIPFDVTFGDVTTSNVIVEGKVNSWYLPDEVRRTMRVVGGQTVTGLVTVDGDVQVLTHVEVTGSTGTSVRVQIANQAILLSDDAEIEGSVTFNGPLTVASLTSETGIVNGIDLPSLYRNAWYRDERTHLTGRLVFQARVIMEQGVIVNGEIDHLDVEKLYKETAEVLSHYGDQTVKLKKNYGEVCGPITAIYKELRSSIYEGDYFKTVRQQRIPYHRHSSTSFQAFNETYIIMSWGDGRCDSTLYVFDSTVPELVEVLTIADSGYAHQWLLLEGTNDVLLVMAGSPRGNKCTRRNSAIWKFDGSSMEVYQELAAGERVSVARVGDGVVMVFVHTLQHTVTYRLDHSTRLFTQTDTIPGYVDISVSLKTKVGRVVMFWAHGRSGKVIVDGVFGGSLDYFDEIIDAVMFHQVGRVFLALVVTRGHCMEPEYDLELYSVELETKTVTCLDAQHMAAATTIVAFFAGSEVCGSTIITAIQQNVFPLVYRLLGEKLLVFSEECIPRVVWAQYISVPGQRFPELVDHYVLLGQDDKMVLLRKLVMRGAAVPPRSLDCDIDAFSDPRLAPHVHVYNDGP